MKTVLIDLDSTLVDILSPAMEILNKEQNTNFTLEDIVRWDSFYELYDKDRVDKLLNSDEFYRDYVKPIDGSVMFVEYMKKYFNVKVVTAGKNTEFKKKFVRDLFDVETIFEQHKYKIKGDLLIDDKFSTIYTWIKETDKYGILFRNEYKYKYNDNLWHNSKYIICNYYEEILSNCRIILQ